MCARTHTHTHMNAYTYTHKHTTNTHTHTHTHRPPQPRNSSKLTFLPRLARTSSIQTQTEFPSRSRSSSHFLPHRILCQAMACFLRCHKKTIITLIIGTFIGVLFSPLSIWVNTYDSIESSSNPLCARSLAPAEAATPSSSHHHDAVAHRPSNRTQSLTPVAQSPLATKHTDTEALAAAAAAAAPAIQFIEVERTVGPPRDPSVRYKELRSELAQRRLLLTGVVTAKKFLDTRALGIHRTWGKELKDIYFFSSKSDDPDMKLPIITLPDINDTQYPPQRKVYHMLKYMHDHFIDDYDFFMRADDDMYVKVDRLTELLQNINPAQDIYMGCPGFGKPHDR